MQQSPSLQAADTLNRHLPCRNSVSFSASAGPVVRPWTSPQNDSMHHRDMSQDELRPCFDTTPSTPPRLAECLLVRGNKTCLQRIPLVCCQCSLTSCQAMSVSQNSLLIIYTHDRQSCCDISSADSRLRRRCHQHRAVLKPHGIRPHQWLQSQCCAVERHL